MTTFSAGKINYFKLTLALYFLVYSIVPLTYTLSDRQAPERSTATQKEASPIISAHLLVQREFSAERLSSPEENRHSDGNDSVLIKKKRALAPENASEKLFLFKNTSASNDAHDLLAPASYRFNVAPDTIPGRYTGFNSLYAGNSPPSA